MTIRRAVLTLVAVLAMMSAGLSAHPAGTTTVTIATNDPATIEVTIEADAAPLLAKLEALSGESEPLAPVTALEIQTRIARLASVVLTHVELASGGAPAILTWRDVAIGSNQRATIRLVATSLDRARPAVWRSSLVFGSYALVVRRAAGSDDEIDWLQGTQSSRPIAVDAPLAIWQSVRRALALGFLHILPNGLDHILFVLGLYFLSARPRQVLLQVSAFTVAHSITLGLTLYGVVSLPSRVVEPLIALSVAYVGIENLFTNELRSWRVLIVFCFGLLHGMGFAEALANLHLQPSQFLVTLVGFNLGVEGGQLAVISLAAVGLGLSLRARRSWRQPVTHLASAGIGVSGLIWMVGRLID